MTYKLLLFLFDLYLIVWGFQVMLKFPYITNCEVLYQNGKLAIFVTMAEEDNNELLSDRTVTMETHLRNSLPSHYWPDYLQCVKVFPMTRHGRFLIVIYIFISPLQKD